MNTNIENGLKRMDEIWQKYKEDNEVLHVKLDEILLEYCPDEIASKWKEIDKVESFWYA
jgi:hypothetical protein